MKTLLCLIYWLAVSFSAVSAQLDQYFGYTGSVQSFTVPAEVNYMFISICGASGGDWGSYFGGLGGQSNATFSVISGTTYYVYIGGQGVVYDIGGYNGGGVCTVANGNSGGGGSDVRTSSDDLSSRIIVGGGGGGAYDYTASYSGNGGVGGNLVGGAGVSNEASYYAGQGGTQSAGGEGYYSSDDGSFGQGGTGYAAGGGGYYGGGGAYGAGGGGGSSYCVSEDVVMTAGICSGNGWALVSLIYTPTSMPSSVPSGLPTGNPSSWPSSSPSSQPAALPTSIPTQPPVGSSHSNHLSSFADTVGEKVFVSAFFFLLSFFTGWLFRKWIVFRILRLWGFRFRLIYTSVDGKQSSQILPGEIGVTFRGNKVHLFMHSGTECTATVDDGINNGLPKGLFDMLQAELTVSDEERALRTEEVVLSDLLQFHLILFATKSDFLRPQTKRCCCATFTELGVFRGTAYAFCLHRYEIAYLDSLRRANVNVKVESKRVLSSDSQL